VSANHYGDNNVVGEQWNIHGGHNIINQNKGPADPRAAIQELIAAVQTLRGQVSIADRQVIDESMDVVRTADHAEKGTLRRALGNVAGIAAMVGQVGVPVIESVRAVMAALGVQ
jgi:hypothetical protein